ncbi:toll/interleukin-1 receptor domain-containing protein [Shewanella frigidimarina]|uniref:toll/interleukin-1 receptor domain-containing protein n=1 Tax=Shewanella frigidimarina TaxID=56812 RepID=UPI000F4DFE35|nr:toll/interleukin-1 receptor domain-containing protein [Shewanella frigidimarina]RPA57581.1 toll/interleukin-1 receptor domain-containing protein [Shewanella frigidimarina]
MNPPRVFVSYSHDSAGHKKWVLDFATTLRNRGADAVLDQWDLKPGDDLPHFMETQLATADYVVMVCTEKYVEKANSGEGGVGYEKMIMTSSLLSKIDSNKVIPIIRQEGTDHRPTFLKSKLYINFSNDSELEYSLDDLLRVILNAPLYEKPELGKSPFKPLESARPDRTSDGVKELMKSVAKCYERREYDYIWFKSIVDMVSMHRLTLDKYIEEAVNKGLLEWHGNDAINITTDGVNYLETHEIIGG